MGSLSDDIESIADDGRYRPDTKVQKIVERLDLSDVAGEALRNALMTIVRETVERLQERMEEEDDREFNPEENVQEAALELITRRSKNWIRDTDSDLIALVRLMYMSDFYDEIAKRKSFLRDLEEDLQKVKNEAEEIREDT